MNEILTSTAKRFELFKPDTIMIDPHDISHALAHLCNFNGHAREFYCVAQHSCIVAALVPEEHKLAALLYAAADAYVALIDEHPSVWMFVHQHFEELIWQRICERFDLPLETPDCVYQASLVAMATEHRDLMPTDADICDYLDGIEPSAETIRPWPPNDARNAYHQRLMDQLDIEHRRKAA
ncbi:phosphohydrolase [Pseudomonas putida]|uniref:Phosphohydrolase n=1 Tax=Pseudomonas putida TaxID=303 RepID=A0A2C5W0X3_PSEPU|nr:phosphohydrolase [Pseudomonas putida]PHH39795.1 phosphohydrolase [Pseudomonas putida]